jgi:hypothetical protein
MAYSNRAVGLPSSLLLRKPNRTGRRAERAQSCACCLAHSLRVASPTPCVLPRPLHLRDASPTPFACCLSHSLRDASPTPSLFAGSLSQPPSGFVSRQMARAASQYGR